MGMLHPSDISLIGLYSVSTPTKMSLSDGKKLKYIILYLTATSPPPRSK